MIHPRRKAANDERAERLMALQRELWKREDPQAIGLKNSMLRGFAKNHGVPQPFDVGSLSELLPPASALTIAKLQIELSMEPLREAITDLMTTKGPIKISFYDNDYELSAPTSYEEDPSKLAAPLTYHCCRELVVTTAQMLFLVFDPSKEKPLAVEQAHYARLRASVIQLESWLWKRAEEYGGPTDRIPYATRILMLVAFWHPSAHKPPGAWTICVRCGERIHRKNRWPSTIPRCAACMKETPFQRQWPAHAMAPHDRGTWLLRCQYPNCDLAFEGPRHRKLCPDHTSAKLPPSRRISQMR